MLKVENARIVFHPGTVNETEALRGISLHLKPGEFVTVIGGNGAGKSTLLNCVAGANFLTSGRILIDGQDVTNVPEYKRAKYLGRVFQDPMMGTAGNMWIEENLALAYRRGQKRGLRWGISNEERDLFKEQLSQFDLGLEGRLSTKVKLLSGGQRQALTLLMATLVKPKLLLLDEHTAALDPKTAKKVLELSEQIIERDHLTTLMVTHNMRDAIKYGNRLIMLHAGEIAVDVSGEEKKNLTVESLIEKFSEASGSDEVSDKLAL
ncbi:MAG: ABC transporter ATP-binding protein [Clostridia bacterium]|nr:ABC transporter ATP-binding protein [Clostridia bacterium]